jgi:hypothetical protein
LRNLSFFLIIIVLIIGFYLWDASNRYENITFCPSQQEINAFKTQDDSLKTIYQAHFFDKRFSFPRQSIRNIKITKNIPVIGRFIAQTLPIERQEKLIKFLNNPDNFTWKRVTMLHSDADYIIYFYNDKGKSIGKIWLCSSCGQLIAVPFSPNMKFGSLKISKIREIQNLLSID